MSWFTRRPEDHDLEARLRTERPAPRPELLNAVAARVHSRRPRTSLGLRVALAGALTVGMLVAVASMGAASYASNGAQQAAATFTSVFGGFRGGNETTSRRPPPGDDQYDEQCKEQFKQRLKEEEETHKANLRNARTRQEREAEYRRHQRATALIMFEFKRCRGKRGNDHNGHDGHGDNEHDD